MPPPPSRNAWIRRLALGLVAFVALVAVCGGGFLLWLETSAGRRYVARRFEAGVTGQIRGRLSIAEVTGLSRRGLRAHGVRFVSPRGGEVLSVEDLELDVQWSALLRGRFISPRGRVKGGRVTLREGREGRLELDETFRSRESSGEGDAPSSTDPPIDLQHLAASGLTLTVRLRDVPSSQGTGVRGEFHVWVPTPGAPARLDVRELAGRVTIEAPLPIMLRVTTGTLRFDGGDRHRAEVNLRGSMGDARVRLETNVTADGDDARIAAHLTLAREASATDAIPLTLQAAVASMVSSRFRFTVTRE